MTENEITQAVIACAVEVHRELGVGLLESAYAQGLALELSARGIVYAQEVEIGGSYKGRPLGVSFRADLVVEQLVIVEVKAVEAIHDIHRAQLLSYLRLTGLKVGLLLNFHETRLTRGIHRMVNNL